MELYNNPDIFFEKTSHTYWLPDGRELIGLTGLMKKHGLGADYSGIPAATLAKAAAEGTAIHEHLQSYDEGTAVLISPLIEEYRDAILEKSLTHLASEYLVSDNEIVATFIDKVYDTGIEGLVDLADIKTTLAVHTEALAWQLGANKVLFERQNKGIKVRNVFCIHIDKKTRKLKGLIPVTPVSEEEVDALLAAEREGRIYVSEREAPNVSLALPESEIASYVANASALAELKEKVKEAEKKVKEADAIILKYMEEHALTELEAPGGKITRRAASTREGVDTNKLKEKYPNIYEFVKKTSNVSGSITFKPNKQ